jgi:hypothetical protein
MPAPRILMLLRTRCPVTRKRPGGIHTVPPGPAAAIAALKAAVALAAPVGSAPWLVTETAPDGCASGAATCSNSMKSTVYDEAELFASFWTRTRAPAANCGSSRWYSS